LSKDFITEDKLDDAIHKAMAQASDFNFAITVKGGILRGNKNYQELAEPTKKLSASA